MTDSYPEQVYAGVLGKILGVYHGRPVEGWSHERIVEAFGEVTYFVNDAMGLPIVVPDDDISGTFTFFRSLEDSGFPQALSPAQVGDTWLNYIVEEKTILWWGGLGRSTEHTAFLNLKNGIKAPSSGSHAVNGPWLPEQIGAQIFIDAFAMACPGDPDRAAHYVRAAASVSHDGLALDAAVFLGVMEALAFQCRDLHALMDQGVDYVSDSRLLAVIEAVRDQCAKADDWRTVRRWIADHHGYAHYDGPCHMVPNHAIVLMALLMAGDDFGRSLTIATTAGWDTDCNAGNVGCLNGIRLGLAAIDRGPDLRRPVADRMYVVNADGGTAISDAVIEAGRIVETARRIKGANMPSAATRFSFAYPGSTQGFAPCDQHVGRQAALKVGNADRGNGRRALAVELDGLARGVTGSVSTPTFIAPFAATSSFAMVASPTLYPGQTVGVRIAAPGLDVRPYVLVYDLDDRIRKIAGEWSTMTGPEQPLAWEVPATNGLPVYKLGYEFRSDVRFDGQAHILEVDWQGAPREMVIEGSLVRSIWNLSPMWSRAWVSSARHFAPDFKGTLCISHPGENGVVTIGTRQWDDYSVTSTLEFSLNDGAGLVARSNGHRRYYAGILRGDEAMLIRRKDDAVAVLARTPVDGGARGTRALALTVAGRHLALGVDSRPILAADDDAFASGGAGFLVERGTIVADGFAVRSAHRA